MKKREHTDKIHTASSEYESLVTTETTIAENQEDLIDLLEGISGGIEQDLLPYQKLGEDLIANSGHDPKDYFPLLQARRNSREWIGAKILFYLNLVRKYLADGNAKDAVWASLRLAGMETIYVAKIWELDARVGRKQRESGTLQGGNTRAYPAEQKQDWQRRADKIFEKNPRLSKAAAAKIISESLCKEKKEPIPSSTIRQNIHK